MMMEREGEWRERERWHGGRVTSSRHKKGKMKIDRIESKEKICWIVASICSDEDGGRSWEMQGERRKREATEGRAGEAQFQEERKRETWRKTRGM